MYRIVYKLYSWPSIVFCFPLKRKYKNKCITLHMNWFIFFACILCFYRFLFYFPSISSYLNLTKIVSIFFLEIQEKLSHLVSPLIDSFLPIVIPIWQKNPKDICKNNKKRKVYFSFLRLLALRRFTLGYQTLSSVLASYATLFWRGAE